MPTVADMNRSMQAFADTGLDHLGRARARYLRGDIDAEEFELHVEHALRGHSDGCLCWDCVPPGGGPKKPWSTVISGPLLA